MRSFRCISRLIGFVAPAGTIVHPSVYFLLHTRRQNASSASVLRLKRDLDLFKDSAFSGGQVFPWETEVPVPESKIDAFRILICGKTGVGKSTLVNKIFGVEDVVSKLLGSFLDCSQQKERGIRSKAINARHQ